MSSDSTKKTLLVALGVCLVCSVLVASTTVSLRARQEANKKIDKLLNILSTADLSATNVTAEQVFNENIKAILINIETGAQVPESEYNDVVNIANYDIKKVAASPIFGKAIPSDQDIAGIKRMPKYLPIYLVQSADSIEKVILPIYGKGLWSTMYGFIAVNSDLQAVSGITFYEHGETPGLGGEIDNPSWKALWKNKQLFNETGRLILKVIKSAVDRSSPEADYQIDGLSGSTLTTKGVDYTIQFWFGELGYKTFFEKFKMGEIHG